MTKTMKAAVVHSFKAPLQIEDVPMPEPGVGQIVMRVMAVASAILIYMLPKAIGP